MVLNGDASEQKTTEYRGPHPKVLIGSELCDELMQAIACAAQIPERMLRSEEILYGPKDNSDPVLSNLE